MLQNHDSLIILDYKKLNCPEPVIRCRKFCQENQEVLSFSILVDNLAAKENITRFLKKQDYNLQATLEDDVWYIRASKLGQESTNSTQANTDILIENQADKKHQDLRLDKTVVLLSSEFFGKGSDELGSKLMFNFLNTLPELKDELWRIILLNSAVKLTTTNHPALAALKKIEALGVEILVCGTCLEFYKVLQNKQVGETTNMLDVVISLQFATKLIQI